MFTPIREGLSGGPPLTLPMNPGFDGAGKLGKLGKLEAVLLTAQNHAKVARFIAKRAGEL